MRRNAYKMSPLALLTLGACLTLPVAPGAFAQDWGNTTGHSANEGIPPRPDDHTEAVINPSKGKRPLYETMLPLGETIKDVKPLDFDEKPFHTAPLPDGVSTIPAPAAWPLLVLVAVQRRRRRDGQ